MQKERFIRNGKYNSTSDMLVYYEVGHKNVWVREHKNKLEVCYGPCSGNCEYWDLDIKHKPYLMHIVRENSFNTKKILSFVRNNSFNKTDEVKSGLGVKLNLVGKDGNAFAILGLFRNTAKRQGFTDEQINPILEEAKKSDYAHLLSTIIDNCN